jgi:hypothetical protein
LSWHHLQVNASESGRESISVAVASSEISPGEAQYYPEDDPIHATVDDGIDSYKVGGRMMMMRIRMIMMMRMMMMMMTLSLNDRIPV